MMERRKDGREARPVRSVPRPRELRVYLMHRDMGWQWDAGRRPSGHLYVTVGRFVFTTEPK